MAMPRRPSCFVSAGGAQHDRPTNPKEQSPAAAATTVLARACFVLGAANVLLAVQQTLRIIEHSRTRAMISCHGNESAPTHLRHFTTA